MASKFGKALAMGVVGALAVLPLSTSRAQPPGGANRAPPEFWYVEKNNAVVYTPPNKPLWRLADLLKMHAGQNNWSQEILKDDLQEVTYNSGAPGSKFIPRMHMETATVFVVMKGEMHFQVEGQPPVTATRGSIVNILNDTIYSYDVGGDQNALWININPRGVQTVYPATDPPPPPEPGKTVTKVAFAHKPPAYTGRNMLYFNLFEAIAKCQPVGNVVNDEHIYVNPLLGWVNAADNKCMPGVHGNIGGPNAPDWTPTSTFGHLHHGVREWWIVQSGAISGSFEKTGIFHAVEGDVLNAETDMWHQMRAEAPSGPSVRTAVGAYDIVNMQNTAGQTR